ncbi:MAG: hypothetical protein ACKVVT_01845 [Dehalococcoidia bacterium]
MTERRVWTPRDWARLQTRVWREVTAHRGRPSHDARTVLVGILRVLASGGPAPARDAFAAELGMTRRAFDAGVQELDDLRLVVVVPGSGRLATTYTVLRERLDGWLAGEVLWSEPEPLSDHCDPAIVDRSDRATEPLSDRLSDHSDPATSRARVNPPPPPPTTTAAAATTFATAASLFAISARMVATLRRFGIRVSPAWQEDIRTTWAGRYTEAEVEYAAREADLHDGRRRAYVTAVLENARAGASGPRPAAGDDDVLAPGEPGSFERALAAADADGCDDWGDTTNVVPFPRLRRVL